MGKVIAALLFALLAFAQYQPPIGSSTGNVIINGTSCALGSSCAVTTAPCGLTTQVQYNNSGVCGGFGSWNGASLTLDVTANVTAYPGAIVGIVNSPADASNRTLLYAVGFDSYHQGTGTIDDASAFALGVHNTSSGTLLLASGNVAYLLNEGSGDIGDALVQSGTCFQLGAGSIDKCVGFWFSSPIVTAGTIDHLYSFYSEDIAGKSALAYYEWYDSRGVRRVREDSTFDAVGQAIEALYNPQFTKYVAGAANYERVVLGQWNGNVAEIGNEAAGTGTLRPLRFLGASLQFQGSNLAPSLTGTTGSIGGGVLAAGACASGTVAVTNSTTSMTVAVSPNTYPGDGTDFFGYVSANGTVTVKVCALVAVTPAASTYNVRVVQ